MPKTPAVPRVLPLSRALQALGLATLLAAGALAPRAQAAGDAHGGHGSPKADAKPEAKAAKPDTKPDTKAEAKPAAPAKGADPMDALREKLAEKLGAAKAPNAKSPYVMRVTTAEHGSPEAAAKARPSAAALAAAHRATKPGGDGHGDGKGGGHDIHWSYGGAGGPEQWGALKPEFATCSAGKRQSPIDIRDGIRVDLEPVQFSYQPSAFRVVDNGHTIQVNVGQGNSIEVGGNRFELVQFHFHRPSEERINGRQFDMVAHLVHKDLDGKLAVVAVLLDRGSAHPLVQTVWNHLPLEKGMEMASTRATLDLNHLLPTDRRYFTYMGSLTTPPCSEGVLWMVMAQPVTISPEQIGVFARLYPMNARPIQQAAGRLIKQSN